jgi:hypothetical protein
MFSNERTLYVLDHYKQLGLTEIPNTISFSYVVHT